MIQSLYAVYDLVSESFVGGVHCFAADAAAVRMFGDALADPASMLAKHPNDFQLACLGQLDLGTGVITVPPVRVVLTGEAWAASREVSA